MPPSITEVTEAALRGLGRQAFRSGTHRQFACKYASLALGRELNATEKHHVLSGYQMERMEMTL